MERKDFIKTSVRWTLLGLLAFISVMLAAKVTTAPNCSSCPSASGCTSKDNCPL